MIRNKLTFKPFHSLCSGSGVSDNTELLDGSVVLNSYSEKITPQVVASMSPLEHSTPYQVDELPDAVLEDIEQ